METFMTDALTRRRRGYLKSGIVKVLPVKRSSDWLPENADSAFMNTGAKHEYVVPVLARSGSLIDPLGDLTEEEKNTVAKKLGFKEGNDLNVNKRGKENYWINRHVFIDKNGKFLDLSSIGDFISYKILEVNLDYIAPTWEERYNKGTYKFALVFEEEESKIKNTKIDVKKEAYMMFGKIDGSIKKLSDFLWIYYLTNKDGKRLDRNPSLDYVRGEVGRIIEERPGEFLTIITDPQFETKALIQRSINLGLIQRSGSTFKVFGEETTNNSLDELISYLLDDRNNNIRISLLGKIDSGEKEVEFPKRTIEEPKVDSELEKKLKELELENQMLKEKYAENTEIKKGRPKKE
jgi:hypothetical protein